MSTVPRWSRSHRLSAASVVASTAERWARIGLLVLAVLAQIGLMISLITWASDHAAWVDIILTVLSGLVLLAVVSSHRVTEYKLAWVIPLLLFPLFGGAFYLLFARTGYSRAERHHARHIHLRAKEALSWMPEPRAPRLQRAVGQIRAIENLSGWRLYNGTDAQYFTLGDHAFPRMLEDISRAKNYVFCEYYIVAEGKMWEQLFDALAERAAAGVDVRLLYDDIGSLFTLPLRFRNRLQDAGIKVHAAGEVGPVFRLRMNNRDHRKILCVDGRVAYTGGMNIGDEYINRRKRFGHWKDSAIRVEGPAAWSFAVMFLRAWDLTAAESTDFRLFLPRPVEPRRRVRGSLLPYDDTPFDDIELGATVYRNLLRQARRRVDLFTPYLVIGDELLNALTDLAQSGVWVRVIVPGIPDKRLVYEVTRSSYARLISAGVEVYEYSPGFLHSKAMVIDDEFAVVGSVNFDFRSLYLQHECALWIHDHAVIDQITADVNETIGVSRRISLAMCAVPFWRRMLRAVLNTFAPMM